MIRNLCVSDLPFIARVHAAALPGSFLTRFGHDAIERYYYWQFTKAYDIVALGAFNDIELMGFCFGGIFKGAMAGFLFDNWVYMALKVIKHPWLTINQEFRKHLKYGLSVLFMKINSLKYKDIKKYSIGSFTEYFWVLSMAVSPDYQRMGCGNQILKSIEDIACQRGFEQMRLTVRPDNEVAINFYKSQGWQYVLNDGEWTGKMYKLLPTFTPEN